jgi:hypothetical protein
MNYLDLKDLVLPYIGIDEYKPKTGQEREVIVISILCKDELPAQDLKRFIESTAAEILDVDTSEVPDNNDNYPVFIEVKRDKKFWSKFHTVIQDVQNTCGRLDWRISVYKNDNLFKMSDPELLNSVVVNKKIYDRRFLQTNEFDSDLSKLETHEGIQFEAYKGPSTTIIDAFQLDHTPSTMVKNYHNRCLNDYVSLPTHQVGNFYIAEQGDEIILFKEKL